MEGEILGNIKVILIIMLMQISLSYADCDDTIYMNKENRIIELHNRSSIDEYLKSLHNKKDYSFVNLKYRSVVDRRECGKSVGVIISNDDVGKFLNVYSKKTVAQFVKASLNEIHKKEDSDIYYNDTVFIDVEINKLLVTKGAIYSTEMECYLEIYDNENNKIHQQLLSVSDTIPNIKGDPDRFNVAISNIILKFNHDLLTIENLYNEIINIEKYSNDKKKYEKTKYFRKNVLREMFAIGLSGGVGFVDIYGSYAENLKASGKLAGANEFRVTGNIDFSFYWYFHRNIALQSGIYNFNKGTKILLDQESGSYNESWTESVNIEMKLYKQYHVSFLELPLLLNFRIPSPNNKNAFNFAIGPSFGLVISSKLKYYLRTTEQSNNIITNTNSTTDDKELLEEVNLLEDQVYKDTLGNEFTDRYDDYYRRGDVSLLVSVAYERRLKRVGVFLRFLYLHGFISYMDLQQQALLNMVNYNSDIPYDSVVVNEKLPEIKFKTFNIKLGLNVYF